MDTTGTIIGAAVDAADMRRRMGAAALEAAAHGPSPSSWRAVVAARLSHQQWPHGRLRITAVDARTGQPVVFDRDSGVELVDAVAASTSNGVAYRIGSNDYINGGYRRSAENADLAEGYARVLVLSPFGGRSRYPQDWGMHLGAQVDELRAGGSQVETVFPPPDAEHMFGATAMDLSLRPPAARAGRDQGRALAAPLADWWR
jgi:NTE family protein